MEKNGNRTLMHQVMYILKIGLFSSREFKFTKRMFIANY